MRKIKRSCFHNEKGFTLLELMVSSALLTIVLLAMFSVTALSQTVFNETSIHGQLTQSAMQTLRSISREVGQTSPNATPSHLNIAVDADGNNVVCFQIPVDWDNDGDAVSGTLNPAVEWGVYDRAGQTQSGRLGGWACYSVDGTQLIRQVMDNAMAPVNGLDTVVANNVLNFQVVQNVERVQMTITLQGVDQNGQAGGARTFQTTFTSTTFLRNAVN